MAATIRILPSFTVLLIAFSCHSQKEIRIFSPDRTIVFSFRLMKGVPQYSVAYGNKKLIENSGMGLTFDNGMFAGSIKTGASWFREGVEDYFLTVGKSKHVSDPYREVLIPLVQNIAPFRELDLRVRVFNDGLGFRYEFPIANGNGTVTITNENTSFRFTKDPLIKALFLPNFTSSHEGLYTTGRFQNMPEGKLMDMPALLVFPDSVYMAITEAALLDYAGMYLTRNGSSLVSKLSPWPEDTLIKARAALPYHSPWRVLLIGNHIGKLIESNIVTSLSEPLRLKDVSWIRPGKTTFPWWNGNVVPDTLNAPGNNFITQKHYIDFCARNHLEYHSVVEYGLHQWYVDDGDGFSPGPHSDVTKPVPGLNMKEVCDYGKEKGVGIRVWVHWAALYPKLDTAFKVFEKWGLSGMMVDFMDRDDQHMVNMQTEILEKAARHHLHIQFHGAYKPTGLCRTYPNELTREGTLNYENNKWNAAGITPEHDLDIAFTRLLAGPADYHLGGFRAVPEKFYRAQYTRPLMLGTRCHMLGMYVVLESYLSMVCDYPSSYEGQPGFDFIKEVPVTWDETKVLDASVDEFIVIARKKDNNWYIGGINNHHLRKVNLQFNFLGDGHYMAKIYHDAPDCNDQPDHIILETRIMKASDRLQIDLQPGGGLAISLEKIK